jgi:hypothetical protein
MTLQKKLPIAIIEGKDYYIIMRFYEYSVKIKKKIRLQQ